MTHGRTVGVAALATLVALTGALVAVAVAAPRHRAHSRVTARIVHRHSFAPSAARAPQISLGGAVTSVPAGQVSTDPASDPGPDPTTTTTTNTMTTSSTTTGPPALPHRVGITENDQGSLTLKASAVTIATGAITFVVANAGADPHDFSIDDASGHTITQTLIDSKKGANVPVTLAPGTYKLYCSLPGHALAGMQRTVKVQ